jgi:alpha-galactosidase
MNYNNNKAENVKIAYIGGGSRGWAWGLMSDLAAADDISGTVYLYDIDYEAAKNNEIIGEKFKNAEGAKTVWNYKAVKTIGEALTGADFVVISILPGTFDEMESDVHAPEKYGIYQSVGDSSGPGGIVRAMRTLPMFEEIALAVKEYCPDAWVINYTNPMTLCTAQLYKTFPEIKAFGCCHEVFGTQKFLANVADDILGIKDIKREDVKVNVVGVNHFTWLTEAKYKDIDLIPLYKEFCIKHKDTKDLKQSDKNWLNSRFITRERVKMDLFLKTGVIAAAGDRHLAEFCPGKWYLESPERVEEMGFHLTTVAWRKEELAERLAKAEKLISGEEDVKLTETGEDGVRQIRALLGLHTFVTNVNLPNNGQIENLPYGAIVETNAVFSDNKVTPVMSGAIPENVNQLVAKISLEQMALLEAINNRNLEGIFFIFCSDPNVTCSMGEARELFVQMLENTKKYLTDYDLKGFCAQ